MVARDRREVHSAADVVPMIPALPKPNIAGTWVIYQRASSPTGNDEMCRLPAKPLCSVPANPCGPFEVQFVSRHSSMRSSASFANYSRFQWVHGIPSNLSAIRVAIRRGNTPAKEFTTLGRFRASCQPECPVSCVECQPSRFRNTHLFKELWQLSRAECQPTTTKLKKNLN